jgi:hypothetical protein
MFMDILLREDNNVVTTASGVQIFIDAGVPAGV